MDWNDIAVLSQLLDFAEVGLHDLVAP